MSGGAGFYLLFSRPNPGQLGEKMCEIKTTDKIVGVNSFECYGFLVSVDHIICTAEDPKGEGDPIDACIKTSARQRYYNDTPVNAVVQIHESGKHSVTCPSLDSGRCSPPRYKTDDYKWRITRCPYQK